MKVFPEEVDSLLERHPEVVEACAFGVPDAVSGELVGVAIRLMAGRSPSKSELRSWCAERIKSECVPDKWFFVEQFPKTDRGKVKRGDVMRKCLEEQSKQ